MRQKKLWSSFILLFLAGFVMAQITGKVEDEYGPLVGASVSVVGSDAKAETNADGAFSIAGKKGDLIIVTNPMTFNEKKFIVKQLKMGVLKMNQKEVKLEELVVVGFGKQKKENLTGSVAVVDSKAFESRPVTNAVQAMQGQVAGMNFNMGAEGTELGSTMNFNIRGTGTIGGSFSNPLVLIDGVEGSLSALNPQDIESISVLKDAAASSIYGSRAAFGVILVTTKSGKEGKVRISYGSNVSWTAPTVIPQSLDSETFAYYLNEALENDGQKPRFNEAWLKEIIEYKNGLRDDNMTWNKNNNDWYFTRAWGNTKWSDIFYKDWSPSQEHNLSINGGTKSIRYYVSANYLGKEGLLKFNTDTYDRYNFNGRFSADLFSWLNVEYNNRFSRRYIGKPVYANGGSDQFYQTILKKWPVFPAKDPFGNYILQSDVPKLEMGRFTRDLDILTQSLNIKIEPIKNWVTHFNFTYKTNQRIDKKYINPIYSYDENNNPFPVSPDYRDKDFTGSRYLSVNTAGYSGVYNSTMKENFFAPSLFTEYQKDFGLHNVKLLVGFQSELMKRKSFEVSKDGLIVPGKEWLDLTNGARLFAEGGASEWATMGYFSRVNYNYDERYLIEANLRYDGASRFLGKMRWALYPSVSLGWNIARERFWENMGEFFSKFNTFKFRASYGALGNQTTTNPYPYYQKMFLGSSGSWLINGKPTNEAYQPDLISGDLTWEIVSTLNAGLDMSAFRNRFDFSLDFFERKTTGMVGPAPTLPGVFGMKVPPVNNTDLVSRGFEMAIGWNDRIGKDFKYSIRGTLTDSRQQVTKYPNKLKSLAQPYYPGKYLGEIWGFVTHGIAKTDDQMNQWLSLHSQKALGSRWGAGDIMYEDLDNDGIIYVGSNTADKPGDKRIIGNDTPRYSFGLDLSAEYKGVDVRLFFQGVGMRDLYLSGPLFQGFNMPSYWNTTAIVEHLDYFRPADTTSPFGPNLDAYFPRVQFRDGTKNYYPQTKYLQDGSYIRLKNIQIGYTLPKKVSNKIGVNKMRIYFSGENLLTLTNLMKAFDPEAVDAHMEINGRTASGSMYPMSKVLSTGINITF